MSLENQIQRGDLLLRLTRGLEIKGQRSPVLALDPSVVPIVVLEDLTRQGEFLSPKDRTAAVGIAPPAVAGELSGAALLNPAGSGIIVIVDRVVVSVTTQATFLMAGVNNLTILPTYGTNNATVWTDRRNPGFPTALVMSGSDPVSIATPNIPIEAQRIGTAGPFPFWSETAGVVIKEGEGVIIECQTANLAFNLSLRWREISEP